MEKLIQKILRLKLKELDLSLPELAQELGVSLATVKRWMRGEGLNVSNLKGICDYLGLSLSELFASVDALGTQSYRYTLEQEKALAQDPKLLALFDLLTGGKKVAAIKKAYKIPDYILTGLLARLDRLGLIELNGTRVKLIHTGEPQWSSDGPLSAKFRQAMIEDFLGAHLRSEITFTLHDYLPKDLVVIQEKLADLRQFMLLANRRAASRPGEASSYGSYLAFKEYEWNVRDSLKSWS